MELSQLLKTTPETLATEQYNALRAYTIETLKEIIRRLQADDMDGVRKMTYYSPAGDGMGTDSTCINFSCGAGIPEDLGELLDILDNLKKISSNKKTKN